MIIRLLLSFSLIFILIEKSFPQELEKPSFKFSESGGSLVISLGIIKSVGPYYLKTHWFHEVDTNKIHLKYILIQNWEKCKRCLQEIDIRWYLKDSYYNLKNHKQFTYHLDAQEVTLNSKEIKEIMKTLL